MPPLRECGLRWTCPGSRSMALAVRILRHEVYGVKVVRAAVYIRISRPDEREILENQRRAALEYVQRQGWDLVGVYEDVASGGKSDRPGMSRLQDDARGRKFDLVVFTALSRMTRGGIAAALHLLHQFRDNRVGWHFVEQPVLNFDANTQPLARDIILGVLAAVDEDYRRTISRKTKEALNRRKNIGVKLGRHPRGCNCGTKHAEVWLAGRGPSKRPPLQATSTKRRWPEESKGGV